MRRLVLSYYVLLSCVATLCVSALGQGQSPVSYLNDTGSTAYGVNIPVENGFINISNGNLHLEFPLASPPQRGALSVSEKITYDSRIWMFSPFGSGSSYHWWPTNVLGSAPAAAGWQFVTSGAVGSVQQALYDEQDNDCTDSRGNDASDNFYYYRMFWTDPGGTQHTFNSLLVQEDTTCSRPEYPPATMNGSGIATDGSGYSVYLDDDGNPHVVDNTGTQVYPSIIDRYGNFLSADGQGNLMDDTGRVPVIVTQNGNITYYDVLAPNGTINNNGLRVRYTVTSANIQVSTSFLPWASSGIPSPIHSWVGALTPVQSILLPDGVSQYSFTYDNNGEVSSMTLPTGGVIHYGYTDFVDSASTENNWLSSKTVGTNPAMTFTPNVGTTCANYSTGCREYVTLQKPSGDATIYEMTLANGAWNTGLFSYTGPVPSYSGTIPRGPGRVSPLNFTTKTYQYSNACSGSNCVGANYVTESLATTELFSGGLPAVYTQAQSTFDPLSGNPISIKEWDYSSQVSNLNFTSPPSTLPTRETDYTYSGYDLSQVKVLDGLGNQVGLTTYGYTTNATPTSGVMGHGSQNVLGVYLATVAHWVNTAPSAPPPTTYTMDDTGMVTSVLDPKSDLVSTSYQCSNSLPYQVQNPIYQTVLGFDCSSGAATSVQDPNDLAAGRAGTVYTYEATMGRPASVTRPDGGVTTYAYPSITEVDTTVTATPDPAILSKATVDAFGRPSTSIVGGVETDTTYDMNGRTNCVTNPYTTSSSGSTCITAYDGLDRPLSETLQDGTSTRSWSYAANVATSTDERGVAWTRTTDAFGRLTSVAEPAPTGTTQTTYSYDGLGNVSEIVQAGVAANGDAPQYRSFTYDSMSRLLLATNPESGTTCYGTVSSGGVPVAHAVRLPGPTGGPAPPPGCVSGYDANGNLQSKTDARGIVTTFSYDALNRLTFKNYPDGTTAAFGYDGLSAAGTPIAGLANAIGRPSYASNYRNADSRYSYDAAGRIATQYNCLPSTCAYATTTSALYDKAGNMTDLTYPDGRHIQQAFDSAGRLSSSNLADINGVATAQSYLESVAYNPDGSPQVLTLGNGVQQAFTQNTRLQPQNIVVTNPVAPFNGSTYLSHTYCYINCTSGGTANNGMIWGITDALQPLHTQAYSYDNLNRISAFGSGTGASQQYVTDSFGNLSPALMIGGRLSSVNTFDPATNRMSNLPCQASVTPYDAVGNQLCTTDQYGAISQYTYDAENRITQIALLNNAANPFVSYVYGADGARVSKMLAGGTQFTEYVNFGGQTIAERDQSGAWTDYIYAGGNKIARAKSADFLIHTHSDSTPNNVECNTRFQMPGSFVVRTGDLLSWREYKQNAVGGLNLYFDTFGLQWAYADTNGNTINQDYHNNQWVNRTVDLSPFVGHPLYTFELLRDVSSPDGEWDIWYGDISITSADGTVTPIFRDGAAVALSANGCQGPTTNYVGEVQAISTAPLIAGGPTTFYVGDHLGTSQLEFSAGGWPIWQGQFGPFGQELDSQVTTNSYRFAGLEHDSESGLEHADFRQFSPVSTRWMSADPYGGSMRANDPQSLNRYAYVENMPMNFSDPSGLDGGISLGGVGGAISCAGAAASEGTNWRADIACGYEIFELFSHRHPKFHGTTTPRPGAIWNEHGSYQARPYSGVGSILGLTEAGCEFGACGFQQATNAASMADNCSDLPGIGQFVSTATSIANAIPREKLPIPWLRGIAIHAAFTFAVRSIPNVSVNLAYKDRQRSQWHLEGSVRPDAVYGNINSPLYVVELKTGNARLVNPQLANYRKHLPPGTRGCEIYENP